MGRGFGRSVALSSDGRTILVATEPLSQSGRAYIFERGDTRRDGTVITPTATLSDLGALDFSTQIALSADGGTALVTSSRGVLDVFVRAGAHWPAAPAPVLRLPMAGQPQVPQVLLSADGSTALVFSPVMSGGAPIYVRGEHGWAGVRTHAAVLQLGKKNNGRAFAGALSADGRIALLCAESCALYSAGAGGWRGSVGASASLRNLMWDIAGFGTSAALSADGRTALVGASGVGDYTGAAYLYVAGPRGWRASQLPSATLSGRGKGGSFGDHLALSATGGVAIVAAGHGSYLFRRGAHGWQDGAAPAAALSDPLDSSRANDFGGPVALSGDGSTAVIGAPDANHEQGMARLFTGLDRAAGRISTAAASMRPPSTPLRQPSTFFNGEVALSGDGRTALTGLSSGSGMDGAALFVKGAGSWQQAALLGANGLAGGSQDRAIARSMALSADGAVALIGPSLFIRPAAGWTTTVTPTAVLQAIGPPLDGGGVALSADGSTAALIEQTGTSPDAVSLFARGTHGWASVVAPLATIRLPAEAISVSGVSLSGDGSLALIGAPIEQHQSPAYMFARPQTGWSDPLTPTATLTDTRTFNFGQSVALAPDGHTAVVAGNATLGARPTASIFTSSDGWSGVRDADATASIAGPYPGSNRKIQVRISDDGATLLLGLGEPNGLIGEAASSYVFRRADAAWDPVPTAYLGLLQADQVASIAMSGDGGTVLTGSGSEEAAFIQAIPAGPAQGTAG